MRKSCYRFVIVLLCLAPLLAEAQDPQFSQFFAAPLYTNPGFTGASGQTRVGVNYRNQWPSIEANFTTASFFMDHYSERFKSGVGLMGYSDKVELGEFRQTAVYGSYSYKVFFSEFLAVTPGIQLGYVRQNLDFSQLVFGSMIDPNSGTISNPPSGLSAENRDYLDLGFGMVSYYKNFWLGYSASHLTRPNTSSSLGGNHALSVKHVLTFGYKYSFKKRKKHLQREYAVIPVMLYKQQGGFSQLEVGSYFTISPLQVGLWYRGLPLGNVEGKSNHESIVLLTGFTLNGLNIGYSFDYTVSKLSVKAGGAHEISLVYVFSLENKRKAPYHMRRVPCPQF
ncbi:MAG: type IX secretion system membrane protein PorP/SprF [Cytophagales bacterium]|nr:type IX secretion system membrane protein PorP/SprF [Cytophagales bacterium]